MMIKKHSNGVPSEVVTYRNGKREGKALRFDEKGNKLYEYHFKNDVKDGVQLTYDNGKIARVEVYKKGKLDGWSKYYDSRCGLLLKEGQYKNNVKTGLWFEYLNGRLSHVWDYTDNTHVSKVFGDIEINSPPPTPLCDTEDFQGQIIVFH